MKSSLFTLVLTLLAFSGFATTVTVNASSTGYTTTTTKTSGAMTVSNAANRGYAVFNMTAAGIPASATITSVKLVFVYSISGAGTPTDRIYGYVGDISSLSAAALYSGAVTSNTLYTASWGTRATTKTMTTTAAADTFIAQHKTGTISTTWVESASSRVYTITGGGSPHLVITYTCTTPSSVSITSSANPICSGSSETLTGHATGATTYSWAGPNGFTSTVLAPAAFTTSTVSAGVYTFTATSNCGVSTRANLTLAVNTAPAAIGGATTVCIGSSTTLTNTGIGGTWTRSNTKINIGAATGVVTGVTAGTVNISYSTGCGSNVGTLMTVQGTPAAIGGSSAVCVGSSITLTDATAGGTWSSSASGIATVSTGGVVTGVANGSATISYTNGCVAVTKVITVNTTPAAISGSSSVCVGASATLTNSVPGGTWSSSLTSKLTIDPSTGIMTGVASSVSPVITYSTGCGSTATLAVTVLASPAAVGGATQVCSGATTTLTDATTLGSWSSSNSSIATVSSGGIVTGLSQGDITISYTKTGCSAFKAMSVRITPAAISGSSSICSGTASTMTNTSIDGTWSSSASGVATVVPATGIVTGVAAGSANITYSTGCGSNAVKGVTIITTPAAITGTTAVCQAANTTLADATGGGTWSSSDNAIATVSAGGVVRGVAQGTVTISYSVSSCVITTTSVVTGIPAAIGGSTAICLGATSTLTNTITSGTWSTSNSAVASVDASGLVTSVATGTATITYSTGCGSAATAAVTIGIPPTSITGASSMCSGSAATITFTPDVAGGTWSSSNTAVATVDATTGEVTGITDGSADISYTLVTGCGTTVLSQSVAVSLTGKWLGTSSTDWNDAANWPCGTVPDATVNVLIPAGTTYLPDFSAATFAVNNFTIASGTNISISADGIIDVKGNFTNNGIADGDGYVNMSGSAAQTIYGIGKISNLTLNNTHGATINSGDSVKITGDLTLTAGTLTTNSGVKLVSNAAGTGRIAPVTGGAISGNVVAEQYFQGGRRAYRFVGHPFNSFISLNQLTSRIDISGPGGATNGFTTTATNAPSAYWYHTALGNSSLPYDLGWKAFNSANAINDTDKIAKYEGIRLYVRGAKGEGLGFNAYTPSATTMTMYGQVNTGTQTVTMHKGTNSDYNMVSNPYPSAVNIGDVIAAAHAAGMTAGSAFYIWNPFLGVAGGFEPKPIGMSYVLDQNSCFQVRAASEGSTLTFTESNKSGANPDEALLRSAAPQFIALHIYDAANHPWDMTYISFNDKAGNNADNNYDATKAMNPDLNFYSLSSENTKLSIDARPYTNGTIIPLGFTTSYAQQYTIKAENMAIPTGATLFLHDKYTGTYTAMEQGTSYTFTVTADAATQGENRFELTTTANGTDAKALTSVTVNMTPNPATDQVTISFSTATKAATSINIMNVSGVSIINRDLGTEQSGKVTISLSELPAGIYMVAITSGDEKKVQKLVKE